MPPTQLSPDTHWKLKTSAVLGGSIAIALAIWGIGEAWAAKADVKQVHEVQQQVDVLKKQYHELDKNISLISQKQDIALDGQKNIEKKLDDLLGILIRRVDTGYPPGPNPLNNPK
jgi:hypothetical protein